MLCLISRRELQDPRSTGGTSLQLVERIARRSSAIHWVLIEDGAVAPGDVIRFSRSNAPDGLVRGATEPHYSIVLSRTFSGELELCEGGLEATAVINRLDLGTLDSTGLKVFRSVTEEQFESVVMKGSPGLSPRIQESLHPGVNEPPLLELTHKNVTATNQSMRDDAI